MQRDEQRTRTYHPNVVILVVSIFLLAQGFFWTGLIILYLAAFSEWYVFRNQLDNGISIELKSIFQIARNLLSKKS